MSTSTSESPTEAGVTGSTSSSGSTAPVTRGDTTDGVEETSATGSSSSTGEPLVEESSSTTSSDPVFACPEDPLALELNTVDPELTDAAISASPLHFYSAPQGPERGELLVFLPGSNAPPSIYQSVLQVAAAGGYHALGLAYRNEINLFDACVDGPPVCQYNARREILYGENVSLYVIVGAADSIVNRLVRALQHLGWTAYLDADDEPVWSSIAIAGHSQGAGHAALIAQELSVSRAILFSGTEPNDWTEQPLVTPNDRLFGFIHEDDDSYDPMISSWANLGIPGAPTSVDGVDPPYGSQRLTTTLTPAAGNPHGAPATDTDVPLDGAGVPMYVPAWCAVLGLEP